MNLMINSFLNSLSYLVVMVIFNFGFRGGTNLDRIFRQLINLKRETHINVFNTKSGSTIEALFGINYDQIITIYIYISIRKMRCFCFQPDYIHTIDSTKRIFDA